MVVRAAVPSDVPEILAMIRELARYERAEHEALATEEQLRSALFAGSPAVFVLVAEHDRRPGADPQIAGFALWFLNFSTWLGAHGVYLEDLFVRPPFRGHGYGKDLLAELARICRDRGYQRLEWWVLDWNEPAIGFYRNIGARAMDEWTVFRVAGDALADLAGDEQQAAAPPRLGP